MSGSRTLLCLLALPLMCSCASGQEISHDYCQIAQPIYVSHQDVFTDETARQILNHDETWETICKK